MRRLFDYQCPTCGAREEHYTHGEDFKCISCGSMMPKIISPVQCKLEGITGAFPTAYDAWTRMHEQGAKAEAKREL